MTRAELKRCWRSSNLRDIEWYWRPLGLLFKILAVTHCAIGWHEWEKFPDEMRCLWCGKRKP
jgi:hypothetical protein